MNIKDKVHQALATGNRETIKQAFLEWRADKEAKGEEYNQTVELTNILSTFLPKESHNKVPTAGTIEYPSNPEPLPF